MPSLKLPNFYQVAFALWILYSRQTTVWGMLHLDSCTRRNSLVSIYIPCTTCWISGAAYGWLFTDRRPKDCEGPYRRRGIKKGGASTNQRLQWERYEVCKPVLGRLSMASPRRHRPLTQKARSYGQKASSREVRSAPEFPICLRHMRMRTGLRLLYHNPASSPVYESYLRPHTPRSFTYGTYPTTISPLDTHDQRFQPPSFVTFPGLRYVHVTSLRSRRVGSASPPLNV
jgi:hypothetical protein